MHPLQSNPYANPYEYFGISPLSALGIGSAGSSSLLDTNMISHIQGIVPQLSQQQMMASGQGQQSSANGSGQEQSTSGQGADVQSYFVRGLLTHDKVYPQFMFGIDEFGAMAPEPLMAQGMEAMHFYTRAINSPFFNTQNQLVSTTNYPNYGNMIMMPITV